jgi:hypothetical protein
MNSKLRKKHKMILLKIKNNKMINNNKNEIILIRNLIWRILKKISKIWIGVNLVKTQNICKK